MIRAYGFVDINYSREPCTMTHEIGSCFLFIPQIELYQFDSISLLSVTFAWDESLLYSIMDSIHSFQSCFNQIVHPIPNGLRNHRKWCNINRDTLWSMENPEVEMVCIDADTIFRKANGMIQLQRELSSTSNDFYFKLSSTIVLSNMLDSTDGVGSICKECINMNALWATLIVEECTRLGLMYFCIAPGSRSSPLAIAASSHPLTKCISCFDERSLTFHAVGYAKGSHMPAVVITSSGTAVSNLLPAVVEASQNFIPLLLLTADRPPELQDVGANQAINQINHFGSFVKYSFTFPPPVDHISARMVLTTVDSAVYNATSVPYGPVHLNCSFREPLDNSPREWNLGCLSGLDSWMTGVEPFTKYIKMQHSTISDIHGDLAEVVELIKSSNQGILLIGNIHTEEEIWAAILLAKHLHWPVVADILSGLRFRNLLSPFSNTQENIAIIDYLDQALLSDSVKAWAKPDVILQIGSRITSKRIAQMLEASSPVSYIMVDKHPFRHDPSHMISHRIQETVTGFVRYMLNVDFPRRNCQWACILKDLNGMVAAEISFQIHSECLLTEPYVARTISKVLHGDVALFIGNSMVIRDLDMYGCGWLRSTEDMPSFMSGIDLPFHGFRVTGNRGASGIDGLLSTAVGFAVGCSKRVLCVVGDVSFLHDTNGLAILNQRILRKPMTILVINNHGGAIFRLLPIASRTDQSILNKYFCTTHDVSIGKLCEAHSLKHLRAQTNVELLHALDFSAKSQIDCVIEIESCMENNATFHRLLTNSACEAAEHAISQLLRFSIYPFGENHQYKIREMNYSSYRIKLSAPLTSSPLKVTCSSLYREGFILTVHLSDGSIGYGEVAPIEIHHTNMLDVEEQLRFLIHVIRGAEISRHLPLLNGFFSQWILNRLGIPPSSIFPCVRCGLEMAILNALVVKGDYSFSSMRHGHTYQGKEARISNESETRRPFRVQICALVDSNGTPEQVSYLVSQIVDEGFSAVKIKVGRRSNPIEDATVFHEIRRKVGERIRLRADANRKWTYEEAITFGSHVKHCDLQYIEEPVCFEDDLLKFCEVTGLPVALDETIDNIQGNLLDKLSMFVHPGVVAIVIKPSVVGGFENTLLIAKWAQKHGKMAVISSAFESSLSLSTYVQFAFHIDQQNIESRIKNKEAMPVVAHGLGTYKWLSEDVTIKSLEIYAHPPENIVEASVDDAVRLLRSFQVNNDVIQRRYSDREIQTYKLEICLENFNCSFRVHEMGNSINDEVVLFLHGFLGTGKDWYPLMKAISFSTRCVSIDLPGHGNSHIKKHSSKDSEKDFHLSMDVIADLLCNLIDKITSGRVVLVGYSMGARIALYMAMRWNRKVDGAIIISGSPGIRDFSTRRFRIAQDDAKANHLVAHGLCNFLDMWYAGSLWNSLREHPHFKQTLDSRKQHDDVESLAQVLSDLSSGRQPSLWKDLKQCEMPLSFIVGEKDKKFKEIAWQMYHEMTMNKLEEDEEGSIIPEVVEVPDCGHAVHLENPLPVIQTIQNFLTKLNKALVPPAY